TRTLSQGDGSYRLEVMATDTAGNDGSVGTGSAYVLDTTGPAVALVGPASPGNVNQPTFTSTTEAGATTQCSSTGPGGTAKTWYACTSPDKPDLNKGDGTYVYSVRATDTLGNVGTPSSPPHV